MFYRKEDVYVSQGLQQHNNWTADAKTFKIVFCISAIIHVFHVCFQKLATHYSTNFSVFDDRFFNIMLILYIFFKVFSTIKR